MGTHLTGVAQSPSDFGEITFANLDPFSATVLPLRKTAPVNLTWTKNQQPWEVPQVPTGFWNEDSRAAEQEYVAVMSSFRIYGRKPACTAAYSSFVATQPMTLTTLTMVDDDGTPSTSSVVRNVSVGAYDGFCCGGVGVSSLPAASGCLVHALDAQLLYWPPAHSSTAGSGTTAPSSRFNTNESIQTITHPASLKSSVYATGTDGYKYVSPSLYVIYPELYAQDRCGNLGPPLSSVTLAFTPGELSTIINSSSTFPLNINDLSNDPFRARTVQPLTYQPNSNPQISANQAKWLSGLNNGTKPIRFLYSPMLAMPSKLIDLMPAWSTCGIDNVGVEDPPSALGPATVMVPIQTASNPPQADVAAQGPPMPSLPAQTGHVGPQIQSQHPSQGPSADAQVPSQAKLPSAIGHSSESAPPPKSQPPFASGGSHPTYGDMGNTLVPLQTTVPSYASPRNGVGYGPDSAGGHAPGNDPVGAERDNSAGVNVEGPEKTTSGTSLGQAAVAFGNPSLSWDESASKPPPTAQMGPNPPAVVISGQTISDNAAQLTIDGTKVAYQSVAINSYIQSIPTATKSGQTQVEFSTVGGLNFYILPASVQSDPTQLDQNAPNLMSVIDKDSDSAIEYPDSVTRINVGDQTLTLQSNDIEVAGTTLRPNDPAITVNGIPILIEGSTVVVGSRTEILPSPTATVAPEPPVTIGKEIVTPIGGAIVVAGNTLRAGESAFAVNGIRISLGSSMLVVGSQTQGFAFPSSTSGKHDGENIDDLVASGSSGRSNGGLADAPSGIETDLNGCTSRKAPSPVRGQAVRLSCCIQTYAIWAIVKLVVYLIWP